MSKQQYNISENNFEQCIKCTICTVYCPVSTVNQNYPGPKQSGPDGERFRLKDPSFFDESLKYCMNCKRCEIVCPSNVKIGDIIQSARIKYSRRRPKLRDIMLANTDIVGTMSSAFSPIMNRVLRQTPIKLAMDIVLKIDHRRMFPQYSSEKFETWFRKNAAESQLSYKHHISYFHGCYVNYNFPQLGKDLVKIMNAIGYGVHLLDKEKCCGVALISNGLVKQATHQAEHNINLIRESVVDKKMPVITTSSTCTFTIRDEYPNLLGIENGEVRDNVELATRFLFRLIDSRKVKLAFRKDYKMRLAYHTPCHMEKLGWSIYSTSLIRMIPGVDFVMLDSQCCGIAGTYGFKKENYTTSQSIGAPLFRQIEEAKVDFVVTDCETCKWQIEMSTNTKVKNPISILAEALDVDATIELNK